MNNTVLRELQVILLIILVVISMLFLAFGKKNLSGFFFMGATLVGIFLIVTPIMDKVDIKKHNKRIAGVYKFDWGDPLAIETWNGIKVPDSCRIILSKNLEFKIENCPAFIDDSSGYWTWEGDGNYFGVDFFDRDKKDISTFRQESPYNIITIGLEDGRDLVFIKDK